MTWTCANGAVLDHFLEHSDTLMVCVLDRDYRVQATNLAFRDLCHLTEKPIGRYLFELDPFTALEPAAIEPRGDGNAAPDCVMSHPVVLPLDTDLHLFLTVYHCSGTIILFGQLPQADPEGLFAKLGQLTNELAKESRLAQQRAALLAEANQRIEALARVDTLTGLVNRRVLAETCHRLCAAATRHGDVFSVALLDIDFFKRINDTFGHQTGDQALMALGEILRQQSRTEDIPIRFGGEEFLVLLPKTHLAQAQIYAERIRHVCQSSTAPPFTLSIGLTQWAPGDNEERLIQRADRALYQAKEGGRNRVVLAP